MLASWWAALDVAGEQLCFLEELLIGHGGRLQLLLVVVGMMSVVGTYSREEFSSGCELNVPSRVSALNLARP